MTEAVAEFGADDFDAADVADMTVVVNGKETAWKWQFAGPGHEKTIEQANRLSRERLHEDRMREQAVVNNKKWKALEETPDAARARNVRYVVDRLVGWSPVRINGEELAFSAEAATKLLSDPRKGQLFAQAMEFLADTAAFTPASASA